jgi:hypothetical protein
MKSRRLFLSQLLCSLALVSGCCFHSQDQTRTFVLGFGWLKTPRAGTNQPVSTDRTIVGVGLGPDGLAAGYNRQTQMIYPLP